MLANESFCKLVGVSCETIVGKTTSDVLPADEAGKSREHDAKLTDGTLDLIEREVEWPLRGGGAQTLLMRKVALRDGQGKATGIVGLLLDLTERKNLERALAEAHQRWTFALEASGAGVWDWNVRTGDSFFSEQWREMFDPDEGPASHSIEHWASRVHPEDLPRVTHEMLQHLNGSTPLCVCEYRMRCKDGTFKWVASRGRVMVRDEGRPLRLLGTVTDITAQKQLEKELHDAKEEAVAANRNLSGLIVDANRLAERAEVANRAKSDFLATMSHELRTPLNGVLGVLGLLLDGSLTPDQRELAATALSSGQALLGLINDVLDFSKIEAGKLELEIMELEIRPLLEDVFELAAVRARGKKLALSWEVSEDVPERLHGAPGRLRQILTNLLDNAIKFTDSGEVNLHVTVAERDPGAVVVHFAVRDTGIGISPQARDRLFVPFSQIDTSTTRRYGGTGLGLSICRRLAELMGGTVGVESVEQEGSTFWFTARMAECQATPVVRPLEGARIVVIEPHESIRSALLSALAHAGARCEVAGDVRAALLMLGAFRDVTYRAVVCDAAVADAGMLAERALPGGAQRILLCPPNAGGKTVRHKKGSVVTLTLPLRPSRLVKTIEAGADAAPEPESDAPATSNVRPREGRVLVVEDNPVNARVAVRLIERLGYRADVASNGKEALVALERLPYDVVLMDLLMPEMDGLTATKAIRASSRVRAPRVPIVAMTARASPSDREACLAAGMDDYLVKPVDRDGLSEALGRWCPHSAPPSEAGQERSPSPSSIPVFDGTRLIERLEGDRELCGDLVNLFLRDVPDQLRALRSALESGDLKELQRQAHTLRGAAATISTGEMEEAAKEVELAAAEGVLERGP